MDRRTEKIRTYFCFLCKQWRSQLSLTSWIFCDIRRRNGGWNAVEIGAETVSPGREIDRCVLAGDLDQALSRWMWALSRHHADLFGLPMTPDEFGT